MGRQELMRKQKLEREARKKGKKTKAEIAKYIKGKADKTGTTWHDSKGTIIQADAGRNKGRMFKEKAGQNIKNVRDRQKTRENISKGNVKGLGTQVVNRVKDSPSRWSKRIKSLLKIDKKKK